VERKTRVSIRPNPADQKHAVTTDDINVELMLASGVLFVEGDHWRELPFTATHRAGSKQVEADDPTIKMSEHLKNADRIRLVAADGTVEAECVVTRKGKKDSDDHILRNSSMPENGSINDRAGLRVLLSAPVTVPAGGRPNDTTRRKMLFDGLESFDVTAVWDFAVEDKSHALLQSIDDAAGTLKTRFKEVTSATTAGATPRVARSTPASAARAAARSRTGPTSAHGRGCWNRRTPRWQPA